MKLINKETFRSITLILLIISSLIQITILWYGNGHGISIMSSNAAVDSLINSKEVLNEYIKPSKIIASAGMSAPHYHWVAQSKSSEYRMLWDEGKKYLHRIFSQLEPRKRFVGTSEWSRIILKGKAVIYEFPTFIHSDIMSNLFSSDNAKESAPSGVYKMLVSLDEDQNYNENTVYIMDDQNIYKYIVDDVSLNNETSSEIFTGLENASENTYMFMSQLDPDNKYGFEPDYLLAVKGTKKANIPSIKVALPEAFIKGEDNQTIIDVNAVAPKILRGDISGYNHSRNTVDNTVEFKTINDIYKVYPDGTMEYKYLPLPSETDKGSFYEAFNNSIDFIEPIKKLLGSAADLQLSAINEEGNTHYRFTFDYIINDIPVMLKGENNQEKSLIRSAVSIEANSRNIISCRWMIKSFEPVKGNGPEASSEYSIEFNDFLTDAYAKYPEIRLNRTKTIRGITIAYTYKANKEGNLDPFWVIKSDNAMYTIGMRKSSGE